MLLPKDQRDWERALGQTHSGFGREPAAHPVTPTALEAGTVPLGSNNAPSHSLLGLAYSLATVDALYFLTEGSGSLSVGNLVVELTLLEANFMFFPYESFRKYLRDFGRPWIIGILM